MNKQSCPVSILNSYCLILWYFKNESIWVFIRNIRSRFVVFIIIIIIIIIIDIIIIIIIIVNIIVNGITT